LADIDLAADLVAERIVLLPDDGRAVGVVRPAAVRPDDHVTAIRQTRDLAVGLHGEAAKGDCRVRGVDLRQGHSN
jgi:hypothetical protein